MGSSFNSLDIAEDRGRFSETLKKINIPYPEFELQKPLMKLHILQNTFISNLS